MALQQKNQHLQTRPPRNHDLLRVSEPVHRRLLRVAQEYMHLRLLFGLGGVLRVQGRPVRRWRLVHVNPPSKVHILVC